MEGQPNEKFALGGCTGFAEELCTFYSMLTHEERTVSRGCRVLVFLNDHRVIRKRTEDTIVALHPESIQGIEIS